MQLSETLLQRHLNFAVGGTCVVFVWIVTIDLLFAANTQTNLQKIFVQIAKCICQNLNIIVRILKYICVSLTHVTQ